MKTYSTKELEALLADIESDIVERKESWKGDAPTKARQAVCAFANDLPNHNSPGVLFIGAKDKDGSHSGISITDQLLRTIADMKTDGNILPLPVLTVEKRVLKGSEYAVVVVQPSDMPPVKYDGRIWIRTGSRRSIANEQEERILSERRRYKNLPSDILPVPSARLHDLSRVSFEEEYLPRAFASDILTANGRSYEERLASCRMIVSPDDPTPTVLGVLTLSRKPQDFIPGARIQFLRIQGISWGGPVIDELRIDGTLAKQLEQLDQKLLSHNRVQVDFSSSPTEIRHYRYPIAALQQLTRNAVMHRSYEGTNAPIMVYWFDDRIEIINAGGPYGRVTAGNFGKPGFADYRNPNIAETMKVLGFVQRFGVGIQMAQADLAENGNPPAEFKIDLTTIICTVREGERTRNIKVSDKLADKSDSGAELNTPVAPPVTPPVTPPVKKLIELLACKGDMGNAEIRESLALSDRKHLREHYIEPSLNSGYIEYTIPGKPNSRLQKYRITAKGRVIVDSLKSLDNL